jgi:hypothetical protein
VAFVAEDPPQLQEDGESSVPTSTRSRYLRTIYNNIKNFDWIATHPCLTFL